MKQQLYLLLLLLTISVGRSLGYGHGVKGSFSKSFSSSSASASSSAFSSSYSSDPLDISDDNGYRKLGNGAFSSGFSGANGNGAKSGSGAYAGSGSYAGSGAFAGSKSGAFAGSGSGAFAGAGTGTFAGAGTGAFDGAGSGTFGGSGSGSHDGANLLTNSGSLSGSSSGSLSGTGGEVNKYGTGPHNPASAGTKLSFSGSVNGNSGLNIGFNEGQTIKGNNPEILSSGCGGGTGYSQGCALSNGQNYYGGSGAISSTGVQGQTFNPVKIIPENKPVSNGNNIRYNGNINNTPNTVNKVFVNDFQIPEDYVSKTSDQHVHIFPGSEGNINDFKPSSHGTGGPPTFVPSQQTVHTSPELVFNYNHDSIKPGTCKTCKGPFPGPKGSIHDYKPAPKDDNIPQNWTPEEQTQPPLVRPPLDLIHKLPGSPGSVHKSKPVQPGGIIPVAVIPVVVGVPNYNEGYPPKPQVNYKPEQPQPKPGNVAVSLVGHLPGPTDNIHHSVPDNKNTYKHRVPPTVQQVPVIPTYDTNQKPVPSPHLIYSFPGKPGSIRDSKPINGPECANGQCNINPSPYNKKPGVPDCTLGECDEYGGRLGCHGEGCFGPGKKPSYSQSGSEVNSHSKHENGNINIYFDHPTPGTYNPGEKPRDCTKGQCNFDGTYYPTKPLPGTTGKICSGAQCLDFIKPHDSIPVVVAPQPVTQEPELSKPKDINKHSGLDFNLDVRQKPDHSDNIYHGCVGPNCGQVPDASKPNCLGGSCSYNPKNPNPSGHGYTHANSNSKADAHNFQNQERIDVQIDQKPDFKIPNEIPVEVDIPTQPLPEDTPIPKPTPNTRPGSSHDFLLPGNKPYHHHHVKPHSKPTSEIPSQPTISHSKPNPTQPSKHNFANPIQPTQPERENSPQPTPDVTYYQCTEESCALPKPKIPQNNNGCEGNNCQEIPYYTCTGSSCPLPYPTPNQPVPNKPNCQDNQCGAPSFLPPKNINRPLEPSQYAEFGNAANAGANSHRETTNGDIAYTGQFPVEHTIKDENYPKFTGSNSGCRGGTCQLYPGSNSQGFVAGNVFVQKAGGVQVPVVDVYIPHKQPCSGNKCNFPHQQVQNSEAGTGSYSKSSGEEPCPGNKCAVPTDGAYSGNRGNEPCGNGNCGHGIHTVPLGSHSGAQSGSFSGANHSGVKGGCKTGTCSLVPLGSGSYSSSGAFAGSSSSSGSLSGSSSGSAAGPEESFKALKDLLTQNLKQIGFEGETPGVYGGSGSFAHSNSYGYGSSGGSSGAFSSSYSNTKS